jgi:hypothetical protein
MGALLDLLSTMQALKLAGLPAADGCRDGRPRLAGVGDTTLGDDAYDDPMGRSGISP